ncbi:MAG: DnaD domain protein [Dorea sp.]|nr:DnaD domain protein [Dorea sp.]
MSEAETVSRRMSETESIPRRMSEAETASRRMSETETVPRRMSEAEAASRRISGAEASSSARIQEAPSAQRHQSTESDAHPDAASLRDLFARKEAFLSEEYEPLPPVPEVSNLQQYKSRKEFKELLFVAEQYLGKTLSSTDVETIAYFYETLHMSLDLTEYLIEYCVENGHKSMHYIRKVALSWHERGISTVAEAKAGSLSYNRNCYSVLNAFGIKGRSPAASELTYIKKWTEEYGFSLEIIVEACNKTISTIHQPSFDYADTILRDWLSKKVQRLEDIKAIDAGFIKEKERRKKQTSKASASRNKFNNFEGRSYDMNELERKLIQQ